MDYTIGQQYHGFMLQQAGYVDEIKSMLYLFTHAKTGTPLIAVKNDDSNKTFTVSFRTLPSDSTGAAHIIEHSVLSGSKKYPVKDLFDELLKMGLMTFLNAMTFSDRTVYPFATRNEKEYFNLMDIYLDVTLNPLLDKNTFLQEGWHYELKTPEDEVKFVGVVYNEMKGAYSDPLRLIYTSAYAALLPGTPFAVDSGGDPEKIVDLSYEDFRAFHERFYHPGNAVIGVYGNADLEDELKRIDEDFLSKFGSGKPSILTPARRIDGPSDIRIGYAVNPRDTLEGKTYFALCTKLFPIAEYKKNLAFGIISNILYSSDASPLKAAVLSAGLGKDLTGFFIDNMPSTSMFAVLIGADETDKEKFRECYDEALREICEKGLDKDLVFAELNSVEFSEREKSLKSQRGLNYLQAATAAAFYDLDLFEVLKFDELFKSIRQEALEGRYFEDLIEEYLIGNQQSVFLTAFPDPQKNERLAAAARTRLESFRKSLSPEEVDRIVQTTRDLLKHQETSNPPEKLKLLPSLSISDIPEKVDIRAAQVHKLGEVPCITTEVFTNSITYLNIGLDVSALPTELLPWLKLFSNLVTEIGTADRNYMTIAKELARYTGDFSSDFANHIQLKNPLEFHPIQWFNVKILRSYLPQAMELIADIFKNVSFHDRQRIRQIVERNYTWTEQSIKKGGTGIPLSRVSSYLSENGKYQEAVNGITSFFKLRDLVMHYDEKEEQLLATLSLMKEILFNRDNLTFAVTAEADDIVTINTHLPMLTDSFANNSHEDAPRDFQAHPLNEAFIVPAEIVFAVQGGKLFETGLHYSGQLEVLKSIVINDYLHNTIRVKGGAYGTWIESNILTGNIFFISYMDPNVARTYEAFSGIPAAIEALSYGRDAMEQWIISTFGKFDPLLSPAMTGLRARNDLLSGVTPDYRLNLIREIKSTRLEDLKAMAPHFEQLMANPYRCIIGNRDKIEGARQLFEKLIEV
ncbi:MAG: peptidase M16 [FCB group bacterium]|nr:peptidase M16 [FCB group bacterium]